MNTKLLPILGIALLLFCARNELNGVFVRGVDKPVIKLDGIWEVTLNASADSLECEHEDAAWSEILVPGGAMMQGYPVKYDEPFFYRTEFQVPSDYDEKVIKIRFEGVYSYARVWVNGKYVRDHHGGFTAWECNITPYVVPGERAILTVEVTDRSDEISYASGYAKHPIGGILRSVSLLALPHCYPDEIFITTDLDEHYKDATLGINGKIKGASDSLSISLELFDPDGGKLILEHEKHLIIGSTFEIENEIPEVLKWNAEYPNLYRLKISLEKDSDVLWSKWYHVGFRKIEIDGNVFKINGKAVNLRGACRHDIHPALGRVSTPEYDLKDVLLAKEANMNFIRTSHYPCTDYFLELCDQYGIYVENEAAICFIGTNRTPDFLPDRSANDPAFTSRFLAAVGEMITNQRNHPSVVIWSIGNESEFGINTLKSFELAKQLDDTRPVIFSYPGYVPDGVYSYDIVSIHYPDITGYREQRGYEVDHFDDPDRPVLFDEWLHVPAYNVKTLLLDQHVRDFWGRSIDLMWQRSFETPGSMGGAIWGMIDETFMMPEDLEGYNEWWGISFEKTLPGKYAGRTIGYGEWGILDTWRRKKPEFWNTKKAYSPIRVLKTIYDDYDSGSGIIVPVHNRFDFTNLKDVNIRYSYNGAGYEIDSPDIPEHSKGEIILPLKNWDLNVPVRLEFLDKKNQLIDIYHLYKDVREDFRVRPVSGESVEIREDEVKFRLLLENDLEMSVEKATGLIQVYKNGSEEVLLSGPLINMRTRGEMLVYSFYDIVTHAKDWSLDEMAVQIIDGLASVMVKGRYLDNEEVSFHYTVSANGVIEVDYKLGCVPPDLIHEIGISFNISASADALSWKRNGYWTVYPNDHLSSTEGCVSLYPDSRKKYRTKPQKEWQYDTKSFFYSGTEDEKLGELMYIAAASKENILEYQLKFKGGESVSVMGDGSQSCRIQKDNGVLRLYVNEVLDYPGLGWGNYYRGVKMDELESSVIIEIK
jgi:beta-galactosidase